VKHHSAWLVAATVGGLLGSSAQVAEAASKKSSSKDAIIQSLERRLEALEQRLAASEGKQQAAGGDNKAGTVAVAEAPTLKTLDQKVKLIERKMEVEKEVADTAKKSQPKFDAGPEGFSLTSASGEHQLRLRGFVQADGNFFIDDSSKAVAGVSANSYGNLNVPVSGGSGLEPDRFTIRRARLQFAGTLWKYNDFLIAPDFGGGQARLFDAWLDMHYLPYLSLTAGKMKGPVGLERLQRATDLLFIERGYPTELAPNRTIGMMFHGEFAAPGREHKYGGPVNFNDLLTYQIGVFNSTQDNQAVQNSDTATFDNKEFEGRLFGHPFQLASIKWLEGLGMGVAGTYGNPQKAALPSLVSDGQNPIVTYSGIGAQTVGTSASAFSGAVANGNSYRVYPQAYWYWGQYGLFGEYVLSSSTLNNTVATTANGRTSTTVRAITQNNHAWQIAASYMLTGEDNAFQGIKPRKAFDPFNGSWGALQLAARYMELDVDPDTFANYGTSAAPRYLFSDPRNSIQHATTWGVAANWFLNTNVKLSANYEQTYYKNGAQNAAFQTVDRPTEKAFFTRVQFNY
jgi:phosphate-selective porin OprO/OprP